MSEVILCFSLPKVPNYMRSVCKMPMAKRTNAREHRSRSQPGPVPIVPGFMMFLSYKQLPCDAEKAQSKCTPAWVAGGFIAAWHLRLRVLMSFWFSICWYLHGDGFPYELTIHNIWEKLSDIVLLSTRTLPVTSSASGWSKPPPAPP